MVSQLWHISIGKVILTLLLVAASIACVRVVAHKELSEVEVGLAVLQEDRVRRLIFGPEIQGYVATYPLFAEVINTEIVSDLGGYLDRYNVHASERLTYPETGLSEVDPFLLRATKVTATVRVGIRLMNYVGLRLQQLAAMNSVAKNSKEILYTMTPEELSLSVQRVRNAKGMLNAEQKREIAKDIVVLVADMEAVYEAAEQAKGLQLEGENLQRSLGSSAYAAELQNRDASRAKLLPEILSNLNGTLAGLRNAASDGEALVRNARMWKVTLADAMQ
ncbi:MAG: hypothetical protein HY692_05365 [Cyanobacteria bacterium NC_groundwater_1444_Ag_S-0.65um_54_12]|nr:hypothetical protein [Cyanobacteria bacterium NC_groundwater_1444_Ag_S-0.65um_54_12]